MVSIMGTGDRVTGVGSVGVRYRGLGSRSRGIGVTGVGGLV
jgi:hypothetical protein